ncbi:hypothetical protein FQB35_11880 [Crassaminicella thermophila]|uniref:DarT domain-containing protein n=1 Tax=Crassaminicella thermophila TaxID=2599308 RepID=A0A5C0SEU4_CRATE|nr:hypothetical protein [Crassaminicella thermophila]QEK12963.1 hypothetical protein FQB35_11880 [Crassaminicella thermophila]
MIFQDYEKTGVIYHIISLPDLKKALKYGIAFDDKVTYKTKYDGFHQLIDAQKPDWIPSWVIRSKSIFASINYPKNHKFHSHSAVLSIKIDPKRCWVANENYANQIYEPYMLQNVEEFYECKDYLKKEGKMLLKKYWETSLSFEENLKVRMDKIDGYDAEVLINHTIAPEDIEIKYIVSDHRMLNVEEWKKIFCSCRG